MSSQRQRRIAHLSLILVGVSFVAAVMASNTLLQGFRLDLTENDLYTLSPGTRAMLEGVEEPINLYLFFSDRQTADIQYLRAYATRVREMLDEFVNAADGSLSLSMIDPVPFSEEEDRAAQYGLTNLSLAALGDSVYFGLAATNTVGDEAVIELFDPEKEASLEYDLARLIYSLATPEKDVVGMLSGVPMTGGFNPQTQQPSPPWMINQQVRQVVEVRSLASSFTQIDDDVSLLWIVHPTGLDDATLYAIDQFLLGGGRALIFVDPMAEVAAAMPDPSGQGGATSSNLERLFTAWGLEFDPGQVVVDSRYALSIQTGFGQRPVRHIGLIGLDADAIADGDVITAGLGSINLGTAGALSPAEDAATEFVPLLESSAESGLMPAARFQFLADPEQLLDDFVPDGRQHVLAARIEGPIETAFPDGPPEGADASSAPHLSSRDDADLIVVADVDILSDRLWVQRQRSLLGQQLMTAFANNGDFVTNAIGNLAGSSDLVGLRSRATFSRPFDRVEALRREAEAQFRATEQRLQAELAETERRLSELQSAREDAGAGSLLMTPEQQVEIERFRDQQLRIRQDLRTVQRELDSSIERLGTNLQIINILVVPLGFALLALLVHWIGRSRRSAKR